MNQLTPFYVNSGLGNTILTKQMLEDWKRDYLKLEWDKSTYKKLKRNNKATTKQMMIGVAKGFIKYNWPLLIGVVLASFFNFVQFLLIAIPLTVIQLVIWFVFVGRVFSFMSIASVVELEKGE